MPGKGSSRVGWNSCEVISAFGTIKDMDLQGIGAVAAAGIAAVGIPAALLVGRWQLRAALRTAEETGRAGIAQADASYRAALDAVRAQALNEERQWRRGVQRDAYSTFLLSVMAYSQHGTNILETAGRNALEVPAATAASKQLYDDMSSKFFVVKLEGPDEVSTAAEVLHQAATEVVNACRDNGHWNHAYALLGELATAHPTEVSSVRDRIPIARGVWSTEAGVEPSADARQALTEIRELCRSIGLDQQYVSRLCRDSLASTGPVMDASNRLEREIDAFITKAQAALNARTPR
ncbi:hypothetical protein [Streptomyces olivochromogenes]|uniref:hypothetical protein n=1 Tax=Streptomyces olivochromogenes TaxID=1963 RepID=UPI0036B683CB